jgi:dTDP-4-dehydrorhamnose reductase
MRMFVTGASGQVARALNEAAAIMKGVSIAHGARPRMDLLRPDTIAPVMRAFAPDVVVNAAAYTAVDLAEREPDLAFAVNRDGAAAVAEAADRLGAPVIQLSTDYVFDGAKGAPYDEDDPVAPLNVYGRSKLAGEAAALAANPRCLILRTAWVYAPFGRNFVRAIIRLAAERDRLRVVDDQIGCPTHAPDLAQVILSIAARLSAAPAGDDFANVIHVAGPRALSWRAFARVVMEGVAERGGRAVPVEAIASGDGPSGARRPRDSRLATDRLAAVFGLTLPAFDQSLTACLDRLIGEAQPHRGRAP